MKKNGSLLFLFFLLTHLGVSQEKPASYSLKEAIDYSLLNNYDVKSSGIDRSIAIAQKNEQRAKGLPQINGNADYLHYQQIQKNILENGVGLISRPDLPQGAVIPTQLGLANQFLPNISGSQVLFDMSYFAGVQAAGALQELASKNTTRTKIDVALAVTKAYYSVLVNQKQLAFLDVNLGRLDSSFKEAQAQYKEGLIRVIDVDRVEVSYNNLKEERNRIARLADLSTVLLKFQMNVPESESINLKDSLDETLLTNVLSTSGEKTDYQNRIEYSILDTQKKLNRFDTRNARAGRYPKLSAIGLIGYNPGASQFGNLSQQNRWIQYSYLGLRLQVPIFNGFAATYRVQQKKLEEDRTTLYKTQLEHAIHLEVNQALINLQNSIESLKTQKRNLQLAEKNLKLFKAESEEGLTTNLEVTVAESDFKEAQTNYYNAVYNALVSKSEYEKAQGTLLK